MPRPAATAVWLALALCDAQDPSVEGPATYAPPRTVEAPTTKAAEAARSASTGTESFTAKGGEHAERVDAPSRQMREGHAHSKSLHEQADTQERRMSALQERIDRLMSRKQEQERKMSALQERHEQADTQERRMSALQERIDRLMSRKQKQERKMSALQERMDTPTPRKQKQQQDAGNSAASFLEEAQTRSAMREVEARALREAEAQLGARHRQLLLARRRGSAFRGARMLSGLAASPEEQPLGPLLTEHTTLTQ